jgi:CRISPR-associated protein Cas2
MFVMVAYDITDDGRRRTVQRVLEAYGERVQFSVFECHIDETQLRSLKAEIDRHLEPQMDQVRWYCLCRGCAGAVEQDGNGPVSEDPSYVVV